MLSSFFSSTASSSSQTWWWCRYQFRDGSCSRKRTWCIVGWAADVCKAKRGSWYAKRKTITFSCCNFYSNSYALMILLILMRVHKHCTILSQQNCRNRSYILKLLQQPTVWDVYTLILRDPIRIKIRSVHHAPQGNLRYQKGIQSFFHVMVKSFPRHPHLEVAVVVVHWQVQLLQICLQKTPNSRQIMPIIIIVITHICKTIKIQEVNPPIRRIITPSGNSVSKCAIKNY